MLAAAPGWMISGFFINGCALGMPLRPPTGVLSGKHPAFALHLL